MVFPQWHFEGTHSTRYTKVVSTMSTLRCQPMEAILLKSILLKSSTGASIAIAIAIATDSSSQIKIRSRIRSSATMDFSALESSPLYVFPSLEVPQFNAAPSFQLPTVADVVGFQNASIEMVKPAKGTTSLAFLYKGGVIVAADSPASIGTYSSSQAGERIVKLGPHMLATKAGFSADSQFFLRVVARECRLYELRYKRPISLCTPSKLLSNILIKLKRSGMPLSMSSIIAGCDESGPCLYYVDSEGERVKGTRFSVGSGSTYTYGVLDNGYKWNMSTEEAVELGRRALYHATFRDGASGGVVSVFHVGPDGWKEMTLEGVSELHDKYYPVQVAPAEVEMSETHMKRRIVQVDSSFLDSCTICYEFVKLDI